MCMLRPAFHSSNVLQLARKVVDADYESIPDGQYSANLIEFVKRYAKFTFWVFFCCYFYYSIFYYHIQFIFYCRCLAVDPEKRPDVVDLATMIPDLLLAHIDSLNQQNSLLKKKLDQEKSNRVGSDHSPNSLLSPGTSFSSSNISSLSQSTNNAKRLRWSLNSATLAAVDNGGANESNFILIIIWVLEIFFSRGKEKISNPSNLAKSNKKMFQIDYLCTENKHSLIFSKSFGDFSF